MIPLVSPSPKRRACIRRNPHGSTRDRHQRKTTYNPINPCRDLDDLIGDLGAETVLAAQIIRQAVADLKEARADKRLERDYPYAADPLGELRTFFSSEWFAWLAAGIGQDPADVLRMIQAAGPTTTLAA